MEVATHGLGINLAVEPITFEPTFMMSDESKKGDIVLTMLRSGEGPRAVLRASTPDSGT